MAVESPQYFFTCQPGRQRIWRKVGRNQRNHVMVQPRTRRCTWPGVDIEPACSHAVHVLVRSTPGPRLPRSPIFSRQYRRRPNGRHQARVGRLDPPSELQNFESKTARYSMPTRERHSLQSSSDCSKCCRRTWIPVGHRLENLFDVSVMTSAAWAGRPMNAAHKPIAIENFIVTPRHPPTEGEMRN